MWKKLRSLAVIAYMDVEPPRFLLIRDWPLGGYTWGLPVVEVGEGDDADVLIRRALERFGLEEGHIAGEGGVPLTDRVTYYVDETKIEQGIHAIGIRADAPEEPVPGLEGEGGAGHPSWLGFEEALRRLTLSGHRKALVRLFTEILKPDLPLAMGPVSGFDHVPVDHPSGLVVLSDFDGTVTEGEASVSILKAFAPEAWQDYERAWLGQELTTHECLGLQFTIIRDRMEEMEKYAAENMRIRGGFREMVGWCRRGGHGFVITSSGMEFYIRAILEANGLGDVPYLANEAIWTDDLGLVVEEGLVNEDCGHCGNCKSLLVDMYKERGARVAFIGDGLTDRCPARKADIVLARNGLLRYCEEEGMECHPYDDFGDVMEILDGLGPWDRGDGPGRDGAHSG